MAEYIDRQAAIKAIESLHDCYNGFSDTYDKACIIGVLEEIAPADVAPARHGRWIDETFSFSRPRCSVCGELCIGLHAFSYVLTNYCPHCGARMDGEADG